MKRRFGSSSLDLKAVFFRVEIRKYFIKHNALYVKRNTTFYDFSVMFLKKNKKVLVLYIVQYMVLRQPGELCWVRAPWSSSQEATRWSQGHPGLPLLEELISSGRLEVTACAFWSWVFVCCLSRYVVMS